MSDLATTQIFATAEKNITATKMNAIIGGASIQPDFFASKPVASSVNPTDNLLILSGGAYAQAPFSTIVNSVGASMTPQITAVRLRSFNAIGNPTFEVDQRNVGAGLVNPASGIFLADRWPLAKALATGTANITRLAGNVGVSVPGTNFAITQNQLYLKLITPQATLAAGEYYLFRQFIEGPKLRELINDAHSISVLVTSSVAPLTFAVYLRDSPATKSLIKLCTIPAANANLMTLITLPNLPLWASGGNWTLTPGVVGYEFGICLAAGSNAIAPAADVWQNGSFMAAPGIDNWFSKAANSTIVFQFVQHESGAQCTTPIDCPFTQNLDDCLRYFTKSYNYSVASGTASSAIGLLTQIVLASQSPLSPIQFKKVMAKTPTLTGYAYDGTINAVRDVTGAVNKTITGAVFPGDSSFGGFNISSPNAANWQTQFHYIADTGW